MSEPLVAAFVVGFIIGGGICSAIVGATFIIALHRPKKIERHRDIPHADGN